MQSISNGALFELKRTFMPQRPPTPPANCLTDAERERLARIDERNKTPWEIVDSRWSEIQFLRELVKRAYGI